MTDFRNSILKVVVNDQLIDRIVHFNLTADQANKSSESKPQFKRRATCMPTNSFLRRESKVPEILLKDESKGDKLGKFLPAIDEGGREEVLSKRQTQGNQEKSSISFTPDFLKPSSLNKHRTTSFHGELSMELKKLNDTPTLKVENHALSNENNSIQSIDVKQTNPKSQTLLSEKKGNSSSQRNQRTILLKEKPHQEKSYRLRGAKPSKARAGLQNDAALNRTTDNGFRNTDLGRETSYSQNKKRILRDQFYFSIEPEVHKQLLKEQAKNKLKHKPEWRTSPFMQ